MQLKAEQKAIVEAALAITTLPEMQRQPGDVSLCVEAVAGSGKSVMLTALARAVPQKQCLFLCHHRNVADRALANLPSNVQVETVDSLAQKTLAASHPRKVAVALPSSVAHERMLAALDQVVSRKDLDRVRQVLTQFYADGATTPDIIHLPDAKDTVDQWPEIPGLSRYILQLARIFWSSQVSRDADSAPLCRQSAIKLWTKSRSGVQGPLAGADVVFLEEAQDSQDVLLDFLGRQNVALLMLGDPMQKLDAHQGFRAMRHSLQQRAQHFGMAVSFRFGPALATLLNGLRDKCDEEGTAIQGQGATNLYGHRARAHWQARKQHYAYIAATPASLLSEALTATQMGMRLSWVEGIEAPYYAIDLVEELVALDTHNSDPAHTITRQWLRRLRNLDSVWDYLRARHATTMLSLCEWVIAHRHPRLLDTVRGWRRDDRLYQEALLAASVNAMPTRDVTLATVEGAKGNEWPRVVVSDDVVPDRLVASWKVTDPDQRLAARWAYTALSRAQMAVAVPDRLLAHFAQHGWNLAENGITKAMDAPTGARHPFFGMDRYHVLEMSPDNRWKRLNQPRVVANTSAGYVRRSGQNAIARQVEKDAQALADHSPEALRAMLVSPRKRRKRQCEDTAETTPKARMSFPDEHLSKD